MPILRIHHLIQMLTHCFESFFYSLYNWPLST